MLIYVGNGSWLPGVPARDLTADEVKLYGGAIALIASGLYEKQPEKPKAEPKKTTEE